MSLDLRRGPLRPVPDATVMLRCRIVFGIWGLAAAGLFWSATRLQVAEVDRWRDLASRQHRIETRMPAERGSIVDRGGVPLALSHETVRIGIAPRELADRARTAALLREALQIPVAEAERLAFSETGWVMVPGWFPPSAGEALSGHQGVYVQRELSRFYTQDAVGRGLLGAVIDRSGAGGIEQQFETHLRGSLGTGLVARDSRGGAIPGEAWEISAPRAGGSVVLAIDAAVQEIVVEALREAVESTRSVGGDVIVTDPRTGEILAMASLRNGNAGRLGGITTSYEPGSTLKPFTVAALLREEKATFDDSVDTGRGSWTFAGRTINDVSTVGTASLRDVLVVSSNVGVAKLAQRLTPAEQYETLRDFGFGVRSGILLPGETSGRLRRPEDWSGQSPASLAIGYEISVTPLQMAMAYGAIANGGVLMQPVLVREIRDSEGRIIRTFPPRPVRRVVSRRVAREITDVLVSVVEEGTGTRARLGSFAVAGKSGTSRAYARDVGYASRAYLPSFVAFFPANDPQILVVVKLERPRGAYYGGSTAAPVTRATMEAILAVREPPVDQGAFAALARPRPGTGGATGPAGSLASFALRVAMPRRPPTPSAVVERGLHGKFALPVLTGHSGRAAARRLHALGLEVLWESPGPVARTEPAAGTPVVAGDTVRLIADPAHRSVARTMPGGAVDE